MATSKPTGSQFDGLLAARKRPAAPPDSPPESLADRPADSPDGPTAKAEKPVAAGVDAGKAAAGSGARGHLPEVRAEAKQLAKSRDRTYQGRTFYVRKRTYADCSHALKTTDDQRDMSDLVEDLLSEWFAKHVSKLKH